MDKERYVMDKFPCENERRMFAFNTLFNAFGKLPGFIYFFVANYICYSKN